jgi:hypothetical protein
MSKIWSVVLKGLYHDFDQTWIITFYSVNVLTTVFKKFHDKIKVVFYVRSSIQQIQYWECKQRLSGMFLFTKYQKMIELHDISQI